MLREKYFFCFEFIQKVSENNWQSVNKKAFKDKVTESVLLSGAYGRYPSKEYVPSKDYAPSSGYGAGSGSNYQNKKSGYQPTIYPNPKPSYSSQGNQINIHLSPNQFLM